MELLEYVIDHVFLPPKLPQEDDSSYDNCKALARQVRDALKAYTALLPAQAPDRSLWTSVTNMVIQLLDARNAKGILSKEKMGQSLVAMVEGDVLALRITKQNSGLIIRRHLNKYSFESFELSPTTDVVMRTKGRLWRCFPGPAIEIGQDRVFDPAFREAFIHCVAQLDEQEIAEACPKTTKADSEVVEIRDTNNPKFVTEMLTGILRGIGQPFTATRIHKRTRDDVLWHDTFAPWRRSPLWLLLRVALQTSLLGVDGSKLVHIRYKSFMVFFMSHMLEYALRNSCSSEVLFIILSKISRRVLKLGSLGEDPDWLKSVKHTVAAAQRELKQRWSSIEENSDPTGYNRLQDLAGLKFVSDTSLKIEKLRLYLREEATMRKPLPSEAHDFESSLSSGHRIAQLASTCPKAGFLNMAVKARTKIWLADLERWVPNCLDKWLNINIYSDSTCNDLAGLTDTYLKAGLSVYTGDPEDFSLMVLILVELWVALDKCATFHEPILKHYPTGIPPSVFDHLLLPKKSQLQRLSVVERHLAGRNTEADSSYPSLFQESNKNTSFAVKYFDQSERHKQLKRTIESAAALDRDNKKAEFVHKKQQYQDLLQQSNSTSCQYHTVLRGKKENRHEVTEHSPSCIKCRLISQAQGMTISVHEWPLPNREIEAKAAVFDLDVPNVITQWRDTTYQLLIDVLSPGVEHPQGPDNKYLLRKSEGVQRFIKSRVARLQLASSTKEFTRAHYREQGVKVATEQSILVNNGMSFSMYDSMTFEWTTKLLGKCTLQWPCTLRLPPGPYKALQYWLDGTSHSSNTVLSKQHKCPKSMTLHEFYAFATLRSGHRLQWRNIARELVSRILNLSHDATYQLLLQAAWQAGPSTSFAICRESHVDLEEQDFGLSLLSALSDALSTVESNWQGAPAARAFIVLATRLLSISPHDSVQKSCLRFLERVRGVTLRWTREVIHLLHNSKQGEELKLLTIRALDLALTCHGTFDVDLDQLELILNSTENVAIVTECAITIHDRRPLTTVKLEKSIEIQLGRFFRLSHSMENILREKIISGSEGMNRTVLHLWTGYEPGSGWTALKSPEEHWLKTKTSTNNGRSSMVVHFNLLDGTLMVNGSPLTRLPQSYEGHGTYRRLFGEKIFEVVPSTMIGMLFETRRDIRGHQVHFALYDRELIIRTRNSQGRIYELIPFRALEEQFPESFVSDYAHWWDTECGGVEWRKLTDPWTSSSQNWQTVPYDNEELSLIKGALKLIDIQSPTAVTISLLLSPLEIKPHINIFFNEHTDTVEVHLPRLNLDFFVEKNRSLLESKQFRGMAVDTNQSFGAFSGLVNKLVLHEVAGSSRLVIVPDGRISFKRHGDHVQVFIDTGFSSQLSYHQYQIDEQLGRLVDNGSLLSRLFKIYLHSLTSHCLPDRLTGRTGTEEGLFGLRQASTRSFLQLRRKHLDLLELIAELTPMRKYYPKHLKVMQTVKWAAGLSPLSQHESFCKEVGVLLSKAESLRIFKELRIPDIPETSCFRGPVELHTRAQIRRSSERSDTFGAEDFTASHDTTYSGRDAVSKRESQACSISRMVDCWSPNAKACPKLLNTVESWGSPIVNKFDAVSLGFDLQWLKPPAAFLPEYWCALHKVLSSTVVGVDKYKVMMFLATLAYSEFADQDLVQTLLAFATVPELWRIAVPDHPHFDLVRGYKPSRDTLRKILVCEAYPFDECPESKLIPLPGESRKAARTRRMDLHLQTRNSMTEEWIATLISQWPIDTVKIPLPSSDVTRYLNVTAPAAEVQRLFRDCFQNCQLKAYIERIQVIIDVASEPKIPNSYSFNTPPSQYQIKLRQFTFRDLLRRRAPTLSQLKEAVPKLKIFSLDSATNMAQGQSLEACKTSKLNELLARLSKLAIGEYEMNYIWDLQLSFDAFTQTKFNIHSELVKAELQKHLNRAKHRVEVVYEKICSHLQAPILVGGLSSELTVLPRLSPSIILSQLASNISVDMGEDWKQALIYYGLAMAELQRAERMLASAGSKAELSNEVLNTGHQNWDPAQHPDWLLLELENNILIRQEQAQIAKEMIQPSSGSNSIMQLNMGLGKSSVIVPIVAATLADGEKLARVVVLKALSLQMFQLLLNKLGGMINRQIFFMPISRSLKLSSAKASQIRTMYEDCVRSGGILLVQPEHILSFELLGLVHSLLVSEPEPNTNGDRVMNNTEHSGKKLLQKESAKVGSQMIETQRWLLKTSRDILDESDEILGVRFELIYTMGSQRATEFSPDRWVIIQRVLDVLSHSAKKTAELYPTGLELLAASPGAFPRVRILHNVAGVELLSRIAREICQSGLPGVSVWNLPVQARAILLKFFMDPAINQQEIGPLQESGLGIESMELALLLLRGLFAGGILHFAFAQKRWRVNYGLDLSRTKLAVPYHAKDSPSARAEFSHPDTTIILTCLSYYYGGLSDKQIYASFEELFLSDHAQEEYDDWTRDLSKLPNSFRQLSGVNLSNTTQCSRDLFPILRFSKGMIDFYMSHLVFPKEMKEFTHKLSSSGWEIGRDKNFPTTGFSGTNDSRYILPVPVKQCDLLEQLSTNAAVLACLLRPENSFDSIFTSAIEVLDAEVLMNMAVNSKPPVRVILDVGAQVLELRNEEVARKWLSRVAGSEVQAAMFFDDANELCVVSRDGRKDSLLVSPFAKQMDRVLVYLDEAHTRGTDLKMPTDYRAIVTLGPELTKDRLAQACMRMRKLGKGQSVVFCGSLEVQAKILESNGKNPGGFIDVADVLSWCIQNTWLHTRKCVPLWATQGVRHYRRRALCATVSGIPNVPEEILEPEAQNLVQRYGFGGQNLELNMLLNSARDDRFALYEPQLEAIRSKCREFGLTSFSGSALHEEQERELQPENEREQQVERPPALPPAIHSLHSDVMEFVLKGILNRFSSAFQPAFKTMANTGASKTFEQKAWPQDLLVTSDFAQTVMSPPGHETDDFLRPVHWIVSGRYYNQVSCVVMSPFEVNQLLPLIRKHKKVTLHVYSPRLSLSNHSLEELSFCAIPPVPSKWVAPSLVPQINLFAGQLYLQSYQEYVTVCRFLGLSSHPPDERVRVACDGFVFPSHRRLLDPSMARNCRFQQSPVAFLKVVMAMRRKGQSFGSSHLGRILNGELLQDKHFEGTVPSGELYVEKRVVEIIELSD